MHPQSGLLKLPRRNWWDRLWGPFWAIPVACTIGALVAGLLLPRVDVGIGPQVPFIFPGGPDGARSALGTIASAMITATSLVFSITMVVLQLASSQFTPRVLGGFLESRVTQVALGVFVATFVFALTVLRSIRGEVDTSGPFVPQVSVTLAFVLVLASVGCFLAFIHHITSSIQVSEVISRIGEQTMAVVDRLYPEHDDGSSLSAGPTWSPRPGTERTAIAASGHGRLAEIDYPFLIRQARKDDHVVVLTHQPGDFVAEGQTVAEVWNGPADERLARRINRAVTLDRTPSMSQDASFGIRQLVDIAERALSPGVNDPTTATQVLDQLHHVLRELVRRETPRPYLADDDGAVRVVQELPGAVELTRLATTEIALYGKDSIQIPLRLRALFDDLLECCLDRYRVGLLGLRDEVLPGSGG